MNSKSLREGNIKEKIDTRKQKKKHKELYAKMKFILFDQNNQNNVMKRGTKKSQKKILN